MDWVVGGGREGEDHTRKSIRPVVHLPLPLLLVCVKFLTAFPCSWMIRRTNYILSISKVEQKLSSPSRKTLIHVSIVPWLSIIQCLPGVYIIVTTIIVNHANTVMEPRRRIKMSGTYSLTIITSVLHI